MKHIKCLALLAIVTAIFILVACDSAGPAPEYSTIITMNTSMEQVAGVGATSPQDTDNPPSQPAGTTLSTADLIAMADEPPVLADGIVYTVNTTDDNDDKSCTVSHCSLREAIDDANASPGLDRINFDIPGPGPHVIEILAKSLPQITDPVIIDGTSEPDYAGVPVVEISGPGQNGYYSTTGLEFYRPDNNTIQGLSITDFTTGIRIKGWPEDPVEHIVIKSNYIGVNADLELGHGNRNGIHTSDVDWATIGGSLPGEGNVIAGNGTGIHLLSVHDENWMSDYHLIQGNFIGTDPTGTLQLGNKIGIRIRGSANNLIGGTTPGAANTIAYNTSFGIQIAQEGLFGGTGNTISHNIIHDNGQMGIDLDYYYNDIFRQHSYGITLNDPGDLDEGPNDALNFPVLTAVEYNGGSYDISGTFNSAANATFDIEFFTNSQCKQNGFGPGESYLGTTSLTTDDNGDASFSVSFPTTLPPGYFITATATDAGGSTSEFSRCRGENMFQGEQLLTVNTTDDNYDGVCDAAHCSLREAIAASNLNWDMDTIAFDIDGPPPYVIEPIVNLPSITDPTTIDATTEPDYAGSPVVELAGGYTGEQQDFPGLETYPIGLHLIAGNTTIRGLAINRFRNLGILIEWSGGNTIQGNYLGLSSTGEAFSRWPVVGMYQLYGLTIMAGADYNLIGGLAPGAGNVISGNEMSGLRIFSDYNTVQGNLIGTNLAGTASAAKQGSGIGIGGNHNQIGGGVPEARNIISGNYGNGIGIGGGNIPSDNVIEGNYIGPDISGTKSFGIDDLNDSSQGIEINAAGTGNRIGGTLPGAGNLISGNNTVGIFISDHGLTGLLIQGNLIGTDVSGQQPLSNGGAGIMTYFDQEGTVIGGLEPGAGNVIAFNKGDGILIKLSEDRTIIILGNSIFSNNYQGIALGTDGQTPNDPGDGDVGSNDLQNYPELETAALMGAAANIDPAFAPGLAADGLINPPMVQGSINSYPNTTYRVQFYSNRKCDPSGYGQGENFLGVVEVTTDAEGNASFSTSLPVNVPAGYFITSTATDPDGNTSEFSACKKVKLLCDAVSGISSKECQALVTLYAETQGMSWDTQTGWLNTLSPCTWYGVTCAGGHVTGLDLSTNQLMGSLPPELKELTFLESLTLPNNALVGEIPTTWSALTNLGSSLSNLAYNALFAPDPVVAALFDQADPGWFDTQTVPPTDLSANVIALDNGTVEVALDWTPIGYTADGGGYEVSYAEASGGPYTAAGMTADKFATGYTLSGLNVDTDYYFVARTHTPAHGSQPNNLWSTFSQELAFNTAVPNLCSIVTEISQAECTTLLSLYNSTDGSNWNNHENWLRTSSPCGWFGVTCSDGQITGLALSSNNLVGTLPDLSALSGLTALDLSSNKLSGPFPDLSSLTDLSTLYLQNNALAGEIPAGFDSLPDPMTALDLSYNALTASDLGVLNFLAANAPGWADTQTVPVSDLNAIGSTATSIDLSWTAIPYTGDGGYYEVSYAYKPDGPWTVAGTTVDKTTTGYTVDRLLPERVVHFRVRTYTPAHDSQLNDLWSEYSTPFSAATEPYISYGNVKSITPVYTELGGGDYQVEIAVTGYYPDGCSGPMVIEQQVTGPNEITITVGMKMPIDTACVGVTRPFNLNLVLDGTFEAGTYTIYVNGMETAFTIP